MATSSRSIRPLTALSVAAARLSFTAAAAFVALLAALHVLKSDLDPSWHFISEYQIGDYGWLMVLAFLCLAVSCLSLCAALWTQLRTIPGYIGLALLVLSAVGFVVAGIFTTDPLLAPEATDRGNLHQLGALLDGISVAALLVTWSLSRNPAWSAKRRLLFWIAPLPLLLDAAYILSMVVLLSQSSGTFGPDVSVGWGGRLLILTQTGWLMTVALCAIKLGATPRIAAQLTLAHPAP